MLTQNKLNRIQIRVEFIEEIANEIFPHDTALWNKINDSNDIIRYTIQDTKMDNTMKTNRIKYHVGLLQEVVEDLYDYDKELAIRLENCNDAIRDIIQN